MCILVLVSAPGCLVANKKHSVVIVCIVVLVSAPGCLVTNTQDAAWGIMCIVVLVSALGCPKDLSDLPKNIKTQKLS